MPMLTRLQFNLQRPRRRTKRRKAALRRVKLTGSHYRAMAPTNPRILTETTRTSMKMRMSQRSQKLQGKVQQKAMRDRQIHLQRIRMPTTIGNHDMRKLLLIRTLHLHAVMVFEIIKANQLLHRPQSTTLLEKERRIFHLILKINSMRS